LFPGEAWAVRVQIYHSRLWQLLRISSDILDLERVAIAVVLVQSNGYPTIRYISKGLLWTLATPIRIELALAIMAIALLGSGRPHVANMAFANLCFCRHASPPYLIIEVCNPTAGRQLLLAARTWN